MAGFSPWAASGLLGGAGQRIALAAGVCAALWLAVLWVSLGVSRPGPTPSAALREMSVASPAAPNLSALALTGGTAPGGGAFDRFGIEMQTVPAPVNSSGEVAFFAKLMHSAAEEGLFLSRDGRPNLVAAVGSPAPGGGSISSFTEHPAPSLNDAGTVAFAASIEGGRASDAVLAWSKGSLAMLAQSGARVPGSAGGTLFDFGPTAIDAAGDVAFLGTVRRGRDTLDAICVVSKGQLAKIVAAGDPAPGGGTFSGLGAPAMNGKGVIAFAAVLEGGPVQGGIFVAGGGDVRRVVGVGDPAPGGGMFMRLSEYVGIDDAGRVAFAAFLGRPAPQSGMFVADANAIRPVATIDAAAPGGGKFVSFAGPPSLAPDGRIAFFAAIEGGAGTSGVYSGNPGGLARIAGIGDIVSGGRRIAYFPLNPTVSAGPGGRVTFQAGVQAGDQQQDAILAYASPRP